MVIVQGPEGSPERSAAESLASALLEEWPWVEDDSDTEVHIIASVKCFGQIPEDLDVVVLARFGDRALMKVGIPTLMADGTAYVPHEVAVRSLALVIEVKDHDPSGVRFDGPNVTVYYRNDGHLKSESATEKNAKQIHSFLAYLRACGLPTPFVENLVWLRNVPSVELPKVPHNILGHRATWRSVVERVYSLTPKSATPRLFSIDHFRKPGGWLVRASADAASRTAVPTRIDRARMDRVASKDRLGSWADSMGVRQVVLRGRGGSGKTVVLLQLAYGAFLRSSKRSLVLTYNRALVADLRRLLSMLGAVDPYESSCVAVQTIDAFLRKAMVSLGVLSADDESYIQRLPDLKRELDELFDCGALTSTDVEGLQGAEPASFDFDYVLIDESQDCPVVERDLLRRFFPPERTVVADGVDQFVRGREHCDWAFGLPKQCIERVALDSCLRMKANLVSFCNMVAEEIGLAGWSLCPHESLPGGKVIVVVGPTEDALRTVPGLLAESRELGNEPIDSLVCVPPLESTPAGGVAAQKLCDAGVKVWDLTVPEQRLEIPPDTGSLRLVQYESCRGLEGWFVVCCSIDDLYELKLAEEPSGLAGKTHAGRWAMIALTRAMDTAVVTVADPQSELGGAILRAARSLPDVVELRGARRYEETSS